MIELKNITKKFGTQSILTNLNMSFKDGELNIVTGPSGCGKTTLFNILSEIDIDFSGEVSGVPKNIAYLFQEDRLLPYHSIYDNVLFTMPEEICSYERAEIADKNLKLMGIFDEKDKYPHELSGGMARRAAIARALSYPGELLLLDEPFNALNIELKKVVLKAIMDIVEKEGKTAIMITHDLSAFENQEALNLIDITKYQKTD